MNDEQRLIDALLARAEEDADRFHRENRAAVPTERWIENSYTAALPLARDASGVDLGPGPHPSLFAAYRRRIGELVGERSSPRNAGAGVEQQPTPGER